MGAREFTDEAERRRRRDLVRRIGDAAFGERSGTWHTDFTKEIAKATGREIGRARVAQWLLETDAAKPVPAWVVDALPAIARSAAADLRARAATLDAAAEDAGAPPGAQGEPEADGEPPHESGPPAAEAAPDVEFDLDGFMDQVLEAGPSGPIDGEEAMPVPPPVETTRAWSSHIGWYQAPVRR